MKRQKGFTLIELLVVIGIIGILAVIILIALRSANIRARDSRRAADLKSLQGPLELFLDQVGTYPERSCMGGADALITSCAGTYKQMILDLEGTGDIRNTEDYLPSGGPLDPRDQTGNNDTDPFWYGYDVNDQGNGFKLSYWSEGSGQREQIP